ncbi:MAG: ribonuclease HII [Proteobacteria bacterium SG_bin5]|nr:ribonuclease HII [Sphingomonas sp.]OQW41020.1 MAG: ribonuclease HII [Proteobacteria bacterium SG_bin5]
MIAGVDEAGRGPLAGPVVAAAVILCSHGIEGLNDSKKLSPARRAELEAIIKARCRWAIARVEPDEIDRLNIFAATMLAMTRAVAALGVDPAEVRIDGNHSPARWRDEWRWPARAIVGGDATEPAISAASILAKEARDALMRQACARWPAYGFSRHKGYGTREHLDALARHGPSPIHRMSFAPCAQALLL